MNKAVAFRAWAQVNDFLPMSQRDIVAFEGCTAAWSKALDARAPDPRRPRPGRDPRLLHHRRAPGVRGHGPRARRARAAAPSSRAGPRRTAGCRSTPPAASRPRATRSAPPASRCTCWRRCRCRGDAGAMQVEGAQARRRLQHGRRLRGELRQHPRAAAIGEPGDLAAIGQRSGRVLPNVRYQPAPSCPPGSTKLLKHLRVVVCLQPTR